MKRTVSRIKGNCPVFHVGDSFYIEEGFRLKMGEQKEICMHALASILPYYVALSRAVEPRELGLNKEDSNVAYVQCLDPVDETDGGTVTFAIEVMR